MHPGIGAMYKEHEKYLRSLALNLAHNRDDAEDLVQDTFERACQYYQPCDRPMNTRAWLATVLYHHFVDLTRRRKRRLLLIERLMELPNIATEEPPKKWLNIESSQIQKALEQIGPSFRAVYELAALDLPYTEIGKRLNLPIATVGTRLMRARRKLKKLLLGNLDTAT